MTASDIANGIVGLVGKSLVFKTADPVTAKFRLLETTRVYAFDRLAESGALTEVAGRHAAYLLKVLGDIEDEQRLKLQYDYLAALHLRANEIHAALEWAFAAAGDPATGLALTIAAVPLWFQEPQQLARKQLSRMPRTPQRGAPGSLAKVDMSLYRLHS